MHIQLGELARRMVLDATGDVIGRVKVPMVDTETWLVDTLRVRLTRRVARELGLPWSWAWWKRPTIDVGTGLINASGDAIILRVSIAELRDNTPLPLLGEVELSIH